MHHINRCQTCGTFTMQDKCPCGGIAVTTKPARYAPDKYGKYRREARKEELVKKGLL